MQLSRSNITNPKNVIVDPLLFRSPLGEVLIKSSFGPLDVIDISMDTIFY